MFGFDFVTAAGLFVLAGNVVTCTVPQPPHISVVPSSAEIDYDFTLSGKALTAVQDDTVSPYAPGTDTTTGGLRRDRPKISTEVHWGMRHYSKRKLSCLWYEDISITIELSPKIYIAKEHDNPVCRAAILEHELHHVTVDRQVVNQYAQGLGRAVKQAVDEVGAMGPYKDHDLDMVRKSLIEHIQNAVDSQKFFLHQEMARRQAIVDSLAEYERVNKICDKGGKR